MESPKINIWAIAVGWFVANITTGIILLPISIIVGLSYAISGTDIDQLVKQLSGSIYFEIIIFAFNFLLTTLAGYLTAMIARGSEIKNAFLMGIVTLLTGFLPHLWVKFNFDWHQAAILLTDIPFALLGGYLRVISYKPVIVESTISEKERKLIRNKKILIGSSIVGGAVILLLFVTAFFVFKFLPKLFFKVPLDLERPVITKGSLMFSKQVFANIFLRENILGKITDIVYRKRAPGLEIGIAGTKGALFLDKSLQVKSTVSFSKESQHVNFIRIKGSDDFRFLDRRHWEGSNCCSSSLIDSNGKTIWTYDGKSGIDDMAAGDIEGNGTMQFVVGFNGAGGIHLLAENGQKKWERPDGNVWHVEFADTGSDGNLKIVHSNAGNNLTVRDKHGTIVNQKHLLHHFTHFSITKWPDKGGKEYVLFSEKDKLWLIDFDGNDIAKFEAPHSKQLGDAKGTLVKIRPNQSEYFAVLVDFDQWGRSCLYIYDSSKELVYQEILPESCEAITAIPINASDVEILLIGCSGKIWQYIAHD